MDDKMMTDILRLSDDPMHLHAAARLTALAEEQDQIAKALRAYPDSDLVDLAKTTAAMAAQLEPAHEALGKLLKWWNDHRYDTIPDGDGDEYNMFDETPEMVTAALRALNPALSEVPR